MAELKEELEEVELMVGFELGGVLQFSLESAAADTKEFSRFGPVSVGPLEGQLNGFSLKGMQVKIPAERKAVFRAGRRGAGGGGAFGGGQECWEVLRGDEVLVGHDHSVLNGGAEFPDVSGPRIVIYRRCCGL